MIQVPTGKKMYIGARKFLEGEVLPPHIAVHLPDDFDEEIAIAAPVEEDKPKRTYAPRKTKSDWGEIE